MGSMSEAEVRQKKVIAEGERVMKRIEAKEKLEKRERYLRELNIVERFQQLEDRLAALEEEK